MPRKWYVIKTTIDNSICVVWLHEGVTASRRLGRRLRWRRWRTIKGTSRQLVRNRRHSAKIDSLVLCNKSVVVFFVVVVWNARMRQACPNSSPRKIRIKLYSEISNFITVNLKIEGNISICQDLLIKELR